MGTVISIDHVIFDWGPSSPLGVQGQFPLFISWWIFCWSIYCTVDRFRVSCEDCIVRAFVYRFLQKCKFWVADNRNMTPIFCVYDIYEPAQKNVWCLQGNEILHRHILVHEIGRLTGCNFDDFIVKNRIFVSGNCKTFLFSNHLGIFIDISFSLRQHVATCAWIRYLDSPASVECSVLREKKNSGS